MKKTSPKSSSPPGTPVSKDHRDSFKESFKSSLFRSFSTSSDNRKPATSSTTGDIEQGHGHTHGHGHGEHAENSAIRAVKHQFKSAHESFRLRMFQEQHGFEPVFMTKKRTRDNKSVMSEFKGGDLNKYTAKTYAIQNGNEVFGDRT
uniref:Uncharacterized protein n=1 Tax=Caenorhabditis japonica TaxID=281687 RepID=A0A8R1DV10_CAEJA